MLRKASRVYDVCLRASTVHTSSCITSPLWWNPGVSSNHNAGSQRLQKTHHRNFITSQKLNKDDDIDLSKDPLIKEWMREMQQDFEKEGKQKYKQEMESKEGREEEKQEQTDSEISPDQIPTKSPMQVWTHFAAKKYETYDPKSSQIIYDYLEERQRQEEKMEEEQEEKEQKKEKLNLKRGVKGVFDIEELVEVLGEENGKDICVVKVPASLNYVGHMVIVSSRSKRHSDALAQIVRQVYNAKKSRRDPPLILEGRGTNWVAMDLRNIALHIMDSETREIYDLETLWCCGSEFDDKSQQEEDVLSLYSNLDPLSGLSPSELISHK